MTTLALTIDIDVLDEKGESFQLIASSQEKEEIAKRLELPSLESLDANLYVRKKDFLFVKGIIVANVIQTCVRTLEPFPQHLELEIDEVFSLAPSSEDEDIEHLEGSTLELGEITVQLLSLSLDPFPVSPSSKPVEYQEDSELKNPFQVLKKKSPKK